MSEHPLEWLGAYMDGELRGLRLRWVENHLDECAACKTELEHLRQLSIMMRTAEPIREFTATDRFVANLTLNLPRRDAPPRTRSAQTLAWWLAPLVLVGLWFFVQTLIILSSAVSLATDSGLLENGTAWLSNGPQQTEWYATTMDLFGGQMNAGTRSTVAALNLATLLGDNVLTQLLWQAGIALLFWVWMAALWLRTSRPPGIPAPTRS
ncbi:MAG: zf-HC2 domain-containing protein [Chloroflexota bacterium]